LISTTRKNMFGPQDIVRKNWQGHGWEERGRTISQDEEVAARSHRWSVLSARRKSHTSPMGARLWGGDMPQRGRRHRCRSKLIKNKRRSQKGCELSTSIDRTGYHAWKGKTLRAIHETEQNGLSVKEKLPLGERGKTISRKKKLRDGLP